MKTILAALLMMIGTFSAYAKSDFTCNGAKARPYAGLKNSYADLTISDDQRNVRFTEFDINSGEMKRETLYKFVKTKEQGTETSGMLRFELVEEVQNFGFSTIYFLYLEPALLKGKNGHIMFPGYYGWDYAYCALPKTE